MLNVSVNNDRYICFDQSGSIVKISRDADDALENLLVDFEEVRMFAEGKETLRDFKVEYDFLEKKYLLKHVTIFNESDNKQYFVYEIPKTELPSKEITIIQNNKDKCWELHLDKDFKKYLDSQKISIDPTTQVYSVTKLYDPNILHKVLKFDNTYKIPFDSKFEFDNLNISVYTIRKFSDYHHEVIND